MSVQSGLVVARYRRHVTVEGSDGTRRECQIKGRSLDPLIGDRVCWESESDAGRAGIVTAVEPRATTLCRVNKRGLPEVVAANLTQLIGVVAPLPQPDWFLVDRYICAGELAALKCAVVYNKADIGAQEDAPLSDYADIGYPVCRASAKEALGFEVLEAVMKGETSAMVGQSGTGKSSLINALLGRAVQTTRGLSAKGAQGRHTTSTAVLYRLPHGGRLIDSPGVRDFAPYIDSPEKLQLGFREFRPFLGLCRFDDCRHVAEPGCAVRAAVASRRIKDRRYASYAALYDLTVALLADRGY
jgi:ribosome biogenesis GTPase